MKPVEAAAAVKALLDRYGKLPSIIGVMVETEVLSALLEGFEAAVEDLAEARPCKACKFRRDCGLLSVKSLFGEAKKSSRCHGTTEYHRNWKWCGPEPGGEA